MSLQHAATWVVGAVLAVGILTAGWIFLLPIPIPLPPFRSSLVQALERSNAEIRKSDRLNISAKGEDIANLLPNGMNIDDVETFLRSEKFYCGPLLDVGEAEAARWGQKYRRYKTCTRCTFFRPFGRF